MDLARMVSETVDRWEAQRPDLELSSMRYGLAMIAMVRTALARADDALAAVGLSLGEFDALAVLRTRGRASVVTPREIAEWSMISPSGLTSRLNRLEKAGLITRELDAHDRRSITATLTAKGCEVADQAIDIMSALHQEMFAPFSAEDASAFLALLEQLMVAYDAKAAE